MESNRPRIWIGSDTPDEIAKQLQAQIDQVGRCNFRVLATTQSADGRHLTVITVHDEPLL